MIIWPNLTTIEKNAKVAEEVMGHRIHIEPRGDGTEEYDVAIVVEEGNVNCIEAIPDYISNISDAWEVLECVISTRKDSCVELEYSKGYAMVAICAPHNKKDMTSRFWATSKTMPEAICVAALLAAGVEIAHEE